jgi:transmembrane E3 ubiquitin-protein ligase
MSVNPLAGNGNPAEVANPWLQFQQQQEQQFQQQMQQRQQQFAMGVGGGGGGGGGLAAAEAAAWRERERRQRSVRVLMMFLLMLLLMDEDNNTNNNEYSPDRLDRLRGSRRYMNDAERKLKGRHLDPAVYDSRQAQEQSLRRLARGHDRYQSLVSMNGGIDFNGAISDWSVEHVDVVRDEFFAEQDTVSNVNKADDGSAENDAATGTQRVWHYPWNTTGFYRGDWNRVTEIDELIEAGTIRAPHAPVPSSPSSSSTRSNSSVARSYSPKQLEDVLLSELRHRSKKVAVLPLPTGFELSKPFNGNTTKDRIDSSPHEHINTMTISHRKSTEEAASSSSWDKQPTTVANPAVTLTRNDGRAAFQLFSKPIAGMAEVSLITGFIKLYDSTAVGYSTRKDVLLRVRGVLLHSIGRVSLVANVATNAVALVIEDESQENGSDRKDLDIVRAAVDSRRRRRRLQNLAAQAYSNSAAVALLRREALTMDESGRQTRIDQPIEESHYMEMTSETLPEYGDMAEDHWSSIVIPYPFVRDDQFESVRNARTPASRTMPEREQALEANAAGCIFEINLDVTPVEWTVGDWRKLVVRRVEEAVAFNPANAPASTDVDADAPSERQDHASHRRATRNSRRATKKLPDQALVMNMVGTIHSCNCNFTAFLNTTALRTDWDATTSKAINYSFYMMIVCLTQILILLRQLLHSQAQSTATRVSLLCVGWQTIIDALMCLAHIYLSLAVQPLFTAFASVAFFKLLIFCVIEMKYMAIIIQARNSSNGGQPADVLRHQVAMLHLRFYGSLMATFLLLFYAQNQYRVFYMLALYSFWLPQIILNIITEAKTPLHKYYIYGMSITRMVAPLYIFGLRKNFLKEVYPESATELFMCEVLVLWVAIQAAILIAQGKYGARFMIPARFLPPKFDYRRPIPASMLPPGALVDLPTPELMEERDDSLRGDSPSKRDGLSDATPIVDGLDQARPRHQTAETTRKRLKGGRRLSPNGNGNSIMTTEDLTSHPPAAAPSPAPVLECSICYDDIDVRDRNQYMLAPCNHLFHAECLKQWMGVKMECPICRTELPAL